MKTAERVVLDVANRRKLGADIASAVTDGERERTMDGASTLTLTVHDPDERLMRSEVLVRNAIRTLGEPEAKTLRPIDLHLDGEWYRLVQVRRSGTQTVLTFEDRIVAYMRAHDEPLAASRGKVTRAQFVRRLVQEVGAKPYKRGRRKIRTPPIPFWSPEIRRKRPVAAATADERKQLSPTAEEDRPDPTRDSDRGRSAKGVTVKGKKATQAQRRRIAIIVDVAEELKAPRKVLIAAIATATQESFMGEQNVSVSGRHRGAFHQDQSPGSTWRQLGGATGDIRKDAAAFIKRSKQVYKAHRDYSIGELAVATQYPAGVIRSEVPAYQQWADEAARSAGMVAGEDATSDTSSGSVEQSSYLKQYQFRRDRGENSWDASGRLAEEVRWRRFVSDGIFIFARDEDLFKRPARMRISPSHPAVGDVEYDLDTGKTVREVTLPILAEQWRVPTGEPIVLEHAGPATGKWLVWSVSDTFGGREVTVTLRQPQTDKREPRPEIATRSADDGSGGEGPVGKIDTRGGAKGIVDQAVRIAREAGGAGVFVVSAYRAGDPLDHGSNDASKAARDIAVKGIDAIVGPPSPKLDKAVVAIGEAFGRTGYGSGTRGPFQTADSFQFGGYRVQIIWRTPRWGGHMGHIHIGVKRN